MRNRSLSQIELEAWASIDIWAKAIWNTSKTLNRGKSGYVPHGVLRDMHSASLKLVQATAVLRDLKLAR